MREIRVSSQSGNSSSCSSRAYRNPTTTALTRVGTATKPKRKVSFDNSITINNPSPSNHQSPQQLQQLQLHQVLLAARHSKAAAATRRAQEALSEVSTLASPSPSPSSFLSSPATRRTSDSDWRVAATAAATVGRTCVGFATQSPSPSLLRLHSDGGSSSSSSSSNRERERERERERGWQTVYSPAPLNLVAHFVSD